MTTTQDNLMNQYKGLIEELEKFEELTQEQKEELKEEQVNTLLEVDVFKKESYVNGEVNHCDYKVKCLITFGGPNISIDFDTRYNGATRNGNWGGEKITRDLTQKELNTFIEMYDVYYGEY